MSLSVLEPHDSWRSVGASEPALLATVLPMTDGDIQRSFKSSADTLQLRAVLDIEGVAHPVQRWSVVFTEKGAIFENYPEESWPKILIEFQSDTPLGPPRVQSFFSRLPQIKLTQLLVRPSNDSVAADVLYTRVLLSLDRARSSSLRDVQAGVVLLSLKHEGLADEDRNDVIGRAKLHRKLRFIETVFGTHFILPEEISADDVRIAETVFQGISSGVSVIRGSDITVIGVASSEIDLTAPPFTGPGEFRRVVSWEKKWIVLFGRKLDVGPVTLVLKTAEIADSRIVEHILGNPEHAVDLRFVVYDHQILHRFERYAVGPMKKRIRRLETFKRQLALEEPRDLAELVSQPMARSVTSSEAIQIASGWLYLNRLPDRYCPQDPELDPQARQWRVPIFLAYADGTGSQVGELLLDSETGTVLRHTPVDQLRIDGAAFAEKLVHV
jgi:hypothetical protein